MSSRNLSILITFIMLFAATEYISAKNGWDSDSLRLPTAIAFYLYLRAVSWAVSKSSFEPLRKVTRDKVLFVRAAGDEASTALGITHGIAALARSGITVWQHFQGKLEAVGNSLSEEWERLIGFIPAQRKALVLLYICATPAIFYYLVSIQPPPPLEWWMLVIMALVLAIVFGLAILLLRHLWVVLAIPIVLLFIFCSMLLLPPLVLLSCAAGFFVGPEVAIASLWLEISPESVPAGRWDIVQIDLGAAEEGQHLRHALYSNPEAIGAIAEWIASRARASAS
jgi:hypothetical protein